MKHQLKMGNVPLAASESSLPLPSVRMLVQDVVPAEEGGVYVHYDLLVKDQITYMDADQWAAYQATYQKKK